MSDLINRQAAIDALDGEIEVTGRINAEAVKGYVRLVRDRLERLPSAQPDIIRCKDCKYSEHWYWVVLNKDKRRCFLWHEAGIDVFEDGYCNYAERREDG